MHNTNTNNNSVIHAGIIDSSVATPNHAGIIDSSVAAPKSALRAGGARRPEERRASIVPDDSWIEVASESIARSNLTKS